MSSEHVSEACSSSSLSQDVDNEPTSAKWLYGPGAAMDSSHCSAVTEKMRLYKKYSCIHRFMPAWNTQHCCFWNIFVNNVYRPYIQSVINHIRTKIFWCVFCLFYFWPIKYTLLRGISHLLWNRHDFSTHWLLWQRSASEIPRWNKTFLPRCWCWTNIGWELCLQNSKMQQVLLFYAIHD